MATSQNKQDFKVIQGILAFVLVLAVNLAVFGFFAPSLVSAPSDVAVISGITLAVVTAIADFWIGLNVFRSLYNYSQTEEEISQ